MKVLMFGWKLPPINYGGSGTACCGFTNDLSKVKGMKGSDVVPEVFGSKNKSNIKLIGPIDGSDVNSKVNLKEFGQSLKFIEVSSVLIPCNRPESYGSEITCRVKGGQVIIELG